MNPLHTLSAMASWLDDRSAAKGGGAETGTAVGQEWGDETKQKSVLLGMGKSSSGGLGGEAMRRKRKSTGEEEEDEERKERTPPNMVREGTGAVRMRRASKTSSFVGGLCVCNA